MTRSSLPTTARRHVDRLTWLDIDDELLVRLRVLNGRDVDLAGDATRTINRCRDALMALSPALERVVGPKLTHSRVQDLMGRWATPTALRAAGKSRVRTLIAKRSPRLADKLTDQIWNALDAQTLTLPAENTWGEVIGDLAGDLTKITSRREALKGDIEEAFLSHPLGKVLVTDRGCSRVWFASIGAPFLGWRRGGFHRVGSADWSGSYLPLK